MSELKTTQDFAAHVQNWYEKHLQVFQHYLDVPVDIPMEIDSVPSTLSGDMHKGFVLAFELIIQELETHPPFVIIPDGQLN
jgi:hypothetical protein